MAMGGRGQPRAQRLPESTRDLPPLACRYAMMRSHANAISNPRPRPRTFGENGLRHQAAQFAFVIYRTVGLLSHNSLPSAGCSGSHTI